MAEVIWSYIQLCLDWMPENWNLLAMGMLGLVFADDIVGMIDRAWRLIGR